MNDELTKRWTIISQKVNNLTTKIDNFDTVTQPTDEYELLQKSLKVLIEEYEDLIIDVNIEILFARVEDQLTQEGYLTIE